MIQGVRTPLTMENIVEYEGHLYFHAYLTNCIFELDPFFEFVKVIKRIPWNTSGTHLAPDYGYLYIFNNKFFLVPDLADNLCVYDRNNDEIRYISIPGCKQYETSFYKGVIVGSYLYLIPCDSDRIAKLNMIDETLEIINSDLIKEHRNIAWGSICVHNDNIFFTELKSDYIFQLDTANDVLSVKSTGIGEGLSGIVRTNSAYWVVPKKFDRLISLKEDFAVLSEQYISIDGYNSGEWSIHKVICIDHQLYFLPRLSNKFLSYNEYDRYFMELKIRDRKKENYIDTYSPISNVCKINNRLYCVYSRTGEMVDLHNKDVVHVPMINAMDGVLFDTMSIERDNGFDNLRNFIEFISK